MRTRFAPSPSGSLHLGSARTALFCYAAARKAGGGYLVRMEDTDAERSTDASRKAIVEGLEWLGLAPDEPMVRQSQLDYQDVIQRAIDSRYCYWCDCPPERLDKVRQEARDRGKLEMYDGKCRDLELPRSDETVLRLNSQKVASEHDEQLGVVIGWTEVGERGLSFPSEQFDDFVLVRSNGSPTYNFAVVADDLRMKISHVIRGDDHISNTAKQILVYYMLGEKPRKFVHLPLILNINGRRLSKRDGATSVQEYAAEGVSPQALRGYLSRLGWSNDTHSEVELGDLGKLGEVFTLEDISHSPAKFDAAKLYSINHAWLLERVEKGAVLEEFAQWFDKHGGKDYPDVKELLKEHSSSNALVTCFASRVNTLKELAEELQEFLQFSGRGYRHEPGQLSSWDNAAILKP